MKNQGQKIRLIDLVDRMMAEQNHNPRDYCFRYVVDRYPKATHDAFDFPGEYVDNLKVDAFTDDGRNLKMDCAQLVMPKGDITCKSTLNFPALRGRGFANQKIYFGILLPRRPSEF